MDIGTILDALPLRAERGLAESVILDNPENFGGAGLMLYSREAVTLREELRMIMTDEEMDARERNAKRTWAAACSCTACGSDWYAGWFDGKVIMYEGDDGMTYEGVPEDLTEPGLIVVCEGESDIRCPLCEEPVTAVRRSDLRRGRTYQLMACALENIGDYTALVWYLVRRQIDRWGYTDEGAEPIYAAVIDTYGSVQLFSRTKPMPNGAVCAGTDWRAQKKLTDPFQVPYYCWGACGNRNIGGVTVRKVPPQLGQTGEKTGLADYMSAGGHWPLQYLLFWQRHPYIENLVKAGWTKAICEQIDLQCSGAIDRRADGIGAGVKLYPEELVFLADWDEAKPHRMLHMSRDGFRQLKPWDLQMLNLWMGLWEIGAAAPGDETEVDRLFRRYGYAALSVWANMISDGWGEELCLAKIDRYLMRQFKRSGMPYGAALQMYLDYREMLEPMVDTPTEAELWPRDLRAAHDGLITGNEANKMQYIAGFRQMYEKWRALEWTDGEICIRLPRTNNELIREGHTLNHCVGRYGKEHVKGDLILFVRHHRRPERSWFTLNIDVRGKKPVQIQLHGYGNEWAKGKHLHIPQRVLDFVERWKTEVLAPVFRQVRAAERDTNRNRKEKTA